MDYPKGVRILNMENLLLIIPVIPIIIIIILIGATKITLIPVLAKNTTLII